MPLNQYGFEIRKPGDTIPTRPLAERQAEGQQKTLIMITRPTVLIMKSQDLDIGV